VPQGNYALHAPKAEGSLPVLLVHGRQYGAPDGNIIERRLHVIEPQDAIEPAGIGAADADVAVLAQLRNEVRL
jgi:hypothetical protein